MKLTLIILLIIILVTISIQVNSIFSQSIVIDEYIYFISALISCSNPLFPLSIYEKHIWFYDHPLVGQYIYSISCLFPNLNFSRFISILFGVFSVFLVFQIGKKLYNENIGLLSSFFYSISIPIIAYFRLAILDSFLSFFILLSIYFLLSNKEKYSWLFGGVAFGVKYAGIILIPILLYKYFLDKKLELKTTLKNISIFILGFVFTNFAALLMWDYISPNKGIFIKVPTIFKTLIYQTYAQQILNIQLFFNNIISYIKILYYQIGLLFIILFLFSSFLILKKKNKTGYFLIIWSIIAFLFAAKIPVSTRYLIPMLPAFFLISSYGIFELYNFCKTKILLVVLIAFLSFIMVYNILSIHPYYLLFGYENGIKNTGATLYGQYTKESIDFINMYTNPTDKIYWDTFSWHPLSFKPSKYNIILHRNITTNITDANYYMIDLQYKLEHPNDENIQYIENNFNLIKEFKIKNITLVYIYKK